MFHKLENYFLAILSVLVENGSDIQNQDLIIQLMHRNRTIMSNHTVGGNVSLK